MDFLLVEDDNDLVIVEELAKEIWTEHYLPIIGIDQVNYMLGKFQTVSAMKQQIAEGYKYYLVQDVDLFVGYFCFSKKKEDLFLSKIYVVRALRGRGYGRECLSFIEKQAKIIGVQGIRLTVNKNNTGALQAYRKLGFKTIDSVVMDIGAGFVMDDYVLRKKVK